MAYIVTKTIKGRRYLYEQRTWREGKRVRTESRYLGPADGGGRPVASEVQPRRRGLLNKVADLIAANTLTDEERGALAAERFAERIDAHQRETFGETAAERADRERQEFLGDLHDRFGLILTPKDPDAIKDTVVDTAEKESPSDNAEGPEASDPGPEGSE